MRIAPLALFVSMLPAGCVIDELREDDVGDAPYCDAAAQWPTHYAELEDELLDVLNAIRVRSGQCGDVMQSPASILDMQPQLRCAARHHATFLATQDAVGHQGHDDTTPAHRVGYAGYEGLAQHELIARDFTDPAEVIEAWLANPEHCRSLYRRGVEHVGIGHSRNAAGDTTAWVVLTGRDRS
jgi:uncharacterized protein YkwD